MDEITTCCPTFCSTFIWQMSIEYLLRARHCAGHWGYNGKQNLCLHVADILVGKTPDRQINERNKKSGSELFCSLGRSIPDRGEH